MNRLLRSSAVALLLSFSGLAASAADRSALVDFGKLSPSAKNEFVEVNLGGALLKFAAICTSKQEPEVAELLRGLKHIRVNVIGLDDSNRDITTERVATIRKELTAQNWSQIVTVQGKKSEDVAVFAKMNSDESIDGIVVTVVDGGKQAVLVNIVGQIKAEQIATLAAHFKIDGLKIAGNAARP